MKQLLYFIIIFFFSYCTTPNKRSVGIQPFNKIPTPLIDSIQSAIKKTYKIDVFQLQQIELPQHAFINIKSPRYRADSLIKYLKTYKPDSLNYILGLTTKDISTTKRDKKGEIKKPEYKYKDWGVFGLGYVAGPSSIVSTYRYKNTNKKLFIERLQKISAHELGHNFGLPHCKSGLPCIMKDAAETIKTVDNVEMVICESCRKKLNN